MEKLTSIDKELLQQVADLHEIPQTSYNIRKNGNLLVRNVDKDIDIISKTKKSGIDVVVHSSVRNKSIHIPVIVTKGGLNDLVYNDFYIKDGAEVVIVAGCGMHNNSSSESSHSGIHTFHIGKNAKVTYIEKHLGLGKKTSNKVLNPTTKIIMEPNSYFEQQTIQMGGVSYSNRKTYATIKAGAELNVKESILTDDNQSAITTFDIKLVGEGSKCQLTSRSVARGNSMQEFKSKLTGKAKCYARVECDAILLDQAKAKSTPIIDAQCVDASLNHEATVGKIAGEQLTKLMSLGLSKNQAEDVIIKGYLTNLK